MFYYLICLVSFGVCVIMVLFIMLLWLLMYLVVECMTRFVLSVSGCCNVGERKVLFIIISVLIVCVVCVMWWMLVICSSGFDGVFIYISVGFLVRLVVSVVGLVRLVKVMLKWFFFVYVLSSC